MNNTELADRLFPEVSIETDFYLNKYPKRNLEAEAKVTRFAPSPTGFIHIGGLFTALVAQRLASQSGGVFFLRIEDTDKNREVKDGVSEIINALNKFGLKIDEGVSIDGTDYGNYGPYIQSVRIDIYKTFIKQLIKEGKAYPCFCTSEELEIIRNKQEDLKIKPGYYGEWAIHRNLSSEEIEKFLSQGKDFVIRLRAENFDLAKSDFNDLIKGKISVTENDTDVVLIKSDKLPTYHFAHVIDDFLMGTTHVIRGDEWLSSLPIHLEVFKAFGWEAPLYGHLAPILKLDEGNKRKLSKRKDPESAVDYYDAEGYPTVAITEYLLNIANSDFEDWRNANPESDNTEFEISLSKFSKSGALFSGDKLDNISKTIISKMTAEEVFENTIAWADKHDKDFKEKLTQNKEQFINIFGIERDTERPRKDIGKWSDVKETTLYFFEDDFQVLIKDKSFVSEYPVSIEHIKEILEAYTKIHNTNVTQQEWFENLKTLATELGYASNMGDFKKNPEQFKGSIADVSMVLRLTLTAKTKAPDLYQMMKVMGDDVVINRIKGVETKL